MSMPPEVQTSMLQDVLSGRLTEIDSFAGELLRRSKQYNIPVPLNEKVYNLIHG
jgi:2-dehydropantoate 2-reductase